MRLETIVASGTLSIRSPQLGEQPRSRHVVGTKAALSPARRRLLGLMQSVNFGTIQALELRDAEPVLVPAPRVLRTIKIGGQANGPRPEVGKPDFVLKAAIVEIFEHFDHIRNGTVAIRVQHGLPTQITVETQL